MFDHADCEAGSIEAEPEHASLRQCEETVDARPSYSEAILHSDHFLMERLSRTMQTRPYAMNDA